MSFFITDAYAATTSAAGVAGHHNPAFSSILMLVIFAAFIYFLMWRPQSKRAKEHRNMITALQKGDEVITSGGLVGKITNIEDSFIKLAISKDAEVMIQKPAIASVLPKGTIKD